VHTFTITYAEQYGAPERQKLLGCQFQTKLLLAIFSGQRTPKVIDTLPVRTTDGQASAQSQICYQRLQNQFDRHFVGGIGGPLVSAEDVLDLAALLDTSLPPDRALTVLQATRHH